MQSFHNRSRHARVAQRPFGDGSSSMVQQQHIMKRVGNGVPVVPGIRCCDSTQTLPARGQVSRATLSVIPNDCIRAAHDRMIGCRAGTRSASRATRLLISSDCIRVQGDSYMARLGGRAMHGRPTRSSNRGQFLLSLRRNMPGAA